MDFYFTPVAPALALIRDGKLRALAAGSPKRSSLFPDLPTTIEAGYPDSDYNFWIGLFVPALVHIGESAADRTRAPVAPISDQEINRRLQG